MPFPKDMLREEGQFSGYDDKELYWQSWRCTEPKATLVVTHGHGEHSECYTNLAQGLLEHGYQIYGWDLRGHGRSEGKRGVVSSFDEYVRDLKLFVEYVRPRLGESPLFLLGHSMGGLVLLKYLMRHGLNWAKGVVLSSPLLGITVEIPPFKKGVARYIGTLAPNLTMATSIPHESLTTDKALLRQYEVDHYRHDRMSPLLYLAILDNIKYVHERADKVPGPLLMQISGNDKVVSHPSSIEFYNSLPLKEKQLIVYDNLTHEIYNDLPRQKPFTDLRRWLEQQLGSKT